MCALTEDERSQHTSEQHKLTERFITPVTLACIDLACKNWYDTISTNAVTHPSPPWFLRFIWITEQVYYA